MKRRKFLKAAGTTSALLTMGGATKLGAMVTRGRSPFTGKPRPENWIETQRLGMYSFLKQGLRSCWITGLSQPSTKHGWSLVESVPLNLKFVEQQLRPVPASLLFIENVTYCYAEVETKTGPLRVDYLGNDIEDTANMILFILELDGKRIGAAGTMQQKDTHITANWYSGIRKGDYAYRIKSNQQQGPRAYQDAWLEIWERKGADKRNCEVSF